MLTETMTTCATDQPGVTMGQLPPIHLPPSCNYIGVFLTLTCNLHCSYCINSFGGLAANRTLLTGDEWVRGLNRITPVSDLPITLQGGEPTLHPDFFAIVNGVRPDQNIDLLTNLELDTPTFMKEIAPEQLKRVAPYASIRVSYHPEATRIEPLAAKVSTLLHSGYSVGIWGVLHPQWEEEISHAKGYCAGMGVDFRTKEFLGEHGGVMHGILSYPEACDRRDRRSVNCRTSELLIGPGGDIYRCHSDLYEGRSSVGHLLDPEFRVLDEFRTCSHYGYCNPCDVKLKTNRFQSFGHTSVEIVFD